jgi:hypothetical protein
VSARRAPLGWLAWFICFVLPACTGPSVEVQPALWVPDGWTPWVWKVEAGQDQQANEFVLVRTLSGHGRLPCAHGVGSFDQRLWAQDGNWVWLACGGELMLVDAREWEHAVVYTARTGVIEEIRAGGGLAALSIDSPGAGRELVLIDWRGREHWTAREDDLRIHAFDIDAGGHVFAYASFDGVTVQPLDGGSAYHLEVQVGEVAFVGPKLITGARDRSGGVHFEWFDTASGERLGELDLDCCDHSSR